MLFPSENLTHTEMVLETVNEGSIRVGEGFENHVTFARQKSALHLLTRQIQHMLNSTQVI